MRTVRLEKNCADRIQDDAGLLHCWGHLGVSCGPSPVHRNPLLLADVPVCHHRQVLQDEGQDIRRHLHLW